MARRKKAVARPTLDQIKTQEGKYIVALLGLPPIGGKAVGVVGTTKPLPDGAPQNAVRTSVMFNLFEPQIVKEDWLDDVDFQRLYDEVVALQIFKSDTIPGKIDKSFPPNLEPILSKTNKETIFRLCMTPYWNYDDNESIGGKAEINALIAMDRQSEGIGERVTQKEVRNFRVKVLIPFLTGWREMEKRFQNRKVVIDKINARLQEIERERVQDLPEWLSRTSARQ